MPNQLSRARAYLIIVLIWAAIFLPALGATEFKGEEGRRAIPAVNMIRTGNWILPTLSGRDYYNKPPFINWLIAGSFLITGRVNEFAARLPSAIFILLFITQLIWIRSDWLNLPARVIAAIVFMTSISIAEKGRLIEIEAVYVCLTAMAVLWWLDMYSRRAKGWLLWLPPAVLLGCGLLTKGPIIVIVFYITVAAVLAYARRLKQLLTLEHLIAIIIFAGMFLGWTYLAQQQTVAQEMGGNWQNQLTTRINPANIDFGRWAQQILRAVVNFLPWLVMVPILWQKHFTSRIPTERLPMFKACRLALLLSFIVLNAFPGTASRYSLPVAVLVSFTLGWILSYHNEILASDRIWRIVVLLGLLAISAASIAGLVLVHQEWVGFDIAAVIIIAAILVWMLRNRMRNALTLTMATGVLIAAAMLLYAVFGSYLVIAQEKRRPVAYAINRALPENATVAVYDPGYQCFLFYLRPPVDYVLSPDEISPDLNYLLIDEPTWQQVSQAQNITARHPQTLIDLTYRDRTRYLLLELQSP
ncbi:MAG: glycosyltransferase family 39 protein [Sedimentisphaerales bacterium]|nr:glycosyltransferase family 39 protein [Sedimentisphaerales bacterium]